MTTTSDAVDTVTTFLRLVEARQLDQAASYLAPGVEIEFPGGRRFDNLEDQVASGAGRFRRVRKVFGSIDALESDDRVIVYVSGTLEGEEVDGKEFSAVRFIDRFALRNGRIVDHKVWNDMAERGISTPGRATDR